MRESSVLTRTQLVGMASGLRSELADLLNMYRRGMIIPSSQPGSENFETVEDAFKNAEQLLTLSEFVPEPADLLPSPDSLLDGTFDDSWMETQR